jgi:hypothetical protein
MVEQGHLPFDLPAAVAPIEGGRPKPAMVFYPDEVSPNGIDLVRPSSNPSYLYEPECFAFLVERAEDYFALGPYLIDYVLSHSSLFRKYKKPDAMFFELHDGIFVLRKLFEFKSNKTNGIQAKVSGFSKFLAAIRETPDAFSAVFNTEFAAITVPDVIVPPNPEVAVTFVTPAPCGHSALNDTQGFEIDYLIVPRQPARRRLELTA